MSIYRTVIVAALASIKRPDIDPRHVEGFMRLQYGTLSHLDAATFKREAQLAVACIHVDGLEAAEANARSFGL
ncbi:MAG: hypothetical protein ACJ768_02660 [Gaiellaceae bacterium]